jgi:hypothetical protein
MIEIRHIETEAKDAAAKAEAISARAINKAKMMLS